MNSILATASDPRVAFEIGNISVKWYGLIIVTAMLLALLYVVFQIKKIGLSVDDAIELFLWVIPLAIVFARIFYVFPGRIDEYFPWRNWDDFVRAIAIWDGGITIIGGLIGGVLGGIFFTIRHRKQTNFASVADLVVVPLLGAQIIGRLGNYINQEAFGLPIHNKAFQCFPFGVKITDPSGVEESFHELVYSNVPGWFCATFFYEMVWNFIGLVMMAAFWFSGKHKKYRGFMLIFYFFWYCLGRFWLEFLRMDAVPVTKIACGIIAPIAFIMGALYIVACDSRESYKKLREEAAKSDGSPAKLGRSVALSRFDVNNYIFVGKALASSKNPLRLWYGKESYLPIDFDGSDFYRVPKDYKRRFAALKKTDEYAAMQK